ncbi:hypothetical protein LTR56_010865 [Elasticomyces elasticus]|nr:hypothetical protein LTR56_010865 [Elasticomyces elasticus]KAK3650262.1 hypothetical protein LTR22_012589 [Elasticomyces elasticus]KAK4911853.1 hypothetical protein LTR49_019653 [Elasticomyces elasticus]KAK5768281.1 hypothetical protein LTS12_001420 [Elasticomyces elasticus]
MKFIFSLVSVIAAATALPTVDTVSKPTTLTLDSFEAVGPSNTPITHINTTPLNTTIRDFVGPPTCANCGNGVSYDIFLNAINSFCSRAVGIPVSATPGAGGYLIVSGHVPYYDNPVEPSSGIIVLQIMAAGNPGCDVQYISNEICTLNFGVPISRCDEGSDVCHGGSALDSCLSWYISATPEGCGTPTLDKKSKNTVLTLSSSEAVGLFNDTYVPVKHIHDTPSAFVGPPQCADCGNGVSWEIAHNVIAGFCAQAAGMGLESPFNPGAGTFTGIYGTWEYYNNPVDFSSGTMVIDVHALGNPDCGVQRFTYEMCTLNLGVSIDQCDGDGPKRGGYATDGCLGWGISANPTGLC